MKNNKILEGLLFMLMLTAFLIMPQSTYAAETNDTISQSDDRYVIGELGDDIISVEEIVNDSALQTRGIGMNSSKSFVFYGTNIAGETQKLFMVTSSCNWITGERITSFRCIETIYNSMVSCSWDTYPYMETDTVYSNRLKIRYKGDIRSIMFNAYLHIGGNSLTLDWYDEV